jgi:hypothetical protein
MTPFWPVRHILPCKFYWSHLSSILQFSSYDELVQGHKVNYVAGGAAQNAARAAAVGFKTLIFFRWDTALINK